MWNKVYALKLAEDNWELLEAIFELGEIVIPTDKDHFLIIVDKDHEGWIKGQQYKCLGWRFKKGAIFNQDMKEFLK